MQFFIAGCHTHVYKILYELCDDLVIIVNIHVKTIEHQQHHN